MLLLMSEKQQLNRYVINTSLNMALYYTDCPISIEKHMEFLDKFF